MKNTLLILVIVLSTIGSAFAQDMNKKYLDPKLEREVLIGCCNTDGLKDGDFGKHYNEQYSSYTPNSSTISKLSSLIKEEDYKITTVFADWCGDSKTQVPRFYKVLNEIDFPEKNIKLIAVDRSKTAQELDITDYDIVRVPTFIIYLDNKELGRIIETPKKSLEKDLLKIIKSSN